MPQRWNIIRIDSIQRYCDIIAQYRLKKQLYYHLTEKHGRLWSEYSNFLSWKSTCRHTATGSKRTFYREFVALTDTPSRHEIFKAINSEYGGIWTSYGYFLKAKSWYIRHKKVSA